MTIEATRHSVDVQFRGIYVSLAPAQPDSDPQVRSSLSLDGRHESQLPRTLDLQGPG
jgi:hypothetical protein